MGIMVPCFSVPTVMQDFVYPSYLSIVGSELATRLGSLKNLQPSHVWQVRFQLWGVLGFARMKEVSGKMKILLDNRDCSKSQS